MWTANNLANESDVNWNPVAQLISLRSPRCRRANTRQFIADNSSWAGGYKIELKGESMRKKKTA